MTGRTVIHRRHLPSRWPISATVLAALILDRLHAPGIVWGVVGTLLAGLWVLVFVDMVTFNDKTPRWKDES